MGIMILRCPRDLDGGIFIDLCSCIRVFIIYCIVSLFCAYIDRWLEIEMGQGDKHRVVIHIECIHDPVFEMSNYRPTGAEHVRKLCV